MALTRKARSATKCIVPRVWNSLGLTHDTDLDQDLKQSYLSFQTSIVIISQLINSNHSIDRSPTTSSMAKCKLTLYLDVVSPFGYMAYYMTRVRFYHNQLFTPYSTGIPMYFLCLLLCAQLSLCFRHTRLKSLVMASRATYCSTCLRQ